MCGSDMKNDPDDGSGGKPLARAELELLTPKEAAAFLRVSDSFLAKARMHVTRTLDELRKAT
jgi:hypothetical protein